MPTESVTCPSCHATIPLQDAKFCPYCGKVLSIPTSVGKQIVVYLVSLLVPPFGFWYVWKYLRQGDKKSRIIGIVSLILTIIAIVLSIWLWEKSVAALNQAMNSSLGGFGLY